MHVNGLVGESHLYVVSSLLSLGLVGASVSAGEGLHSIACHLARPTHDLLAHVNGRNVQFCLGLFLRAGAFFRRLLLCLGNLPFFLSLPSFFLGCLFRYAVLMFFFMVCFCASATGTLCRVIVPLTSASISRLCDMETLPLPAWFCCKCCVKV